MFPRTSGNIFLISESKRKPLLFHQLVVTIHFSFWLIYLLISENRTHLKVSVVHLLLCCSDLLCSSVVSSTTIDCHGKAAITHHYNTITLVLLQKKKRQAEGERERESRLSIDEAFSAEEMFELLLVLIGFVCALCMC